MDAILPNIQAEAAKLVEVLAPLIRAAYLRGLMDGAIAAVVVMLVLFALVRK